MARGTGHPDLASQPNRPLFSVPALVCSLKGHLLGDRLSLLLELPRRDFTLVEQVKLGIREILALWQSEECPEKTQRRASRPEEAGLRTVMTDQYQ